MRLKSALWAAAILLLGPGQICVTASVARITPDDLAVFHAVLSSECRRNDQRYSVISDLPISAPNTAPDWPPTSLWTKLTRRVPSGARWAHLKVCPADRVVDGKEIDSVFARQTAIPPKWEPFYAAFPGASGLLRISLPAFTPDRKRAVVYLDATCNPLCGSGFYIGLTRGKEGWKLSRQQTEWIS
jgi:hypothetical protein